MQPHACASCVAEFYTCYAMCSHHHALFVAATVCVLDRPSAHPTHARTHTRHVWLDHPCLHLAATRARASISRTTASFAVHNCDDAMCGAHHTQQRTAATWRCALVHGAHAAHTHHATSTHVHCAASSARVVAHPDACVAHTCDMCAHRSHVRIAVCTH